MNIVLEGEQSQDPAYLLGLLQQALAENTELRKVLAEIERRAQRTRDHALLLSIRKVARGDEE